MAVGELCPEVLFTMSETGDIRPFSSRWTYELRPYKLFFLKLLSTNKKKENTNIPCYMLNLLEFTSPGTQIVNLYIAMSLGPRSNISKGDRDPSLILIGLNLDTITSGLVFCV